MKYVLLTTIWFFILQGNGLQAQTLFTYGSNKADAAGFIRSYQKLPDTTGNARKAMADYYPLYVNYVLKVQDAYDKGYDTLATIAQETRAFGHQLAEQYINRRANVSQATERVVQHSRQDIYLQYLFIPDSAAKNLAKAVAALEQGQPFEKVVRQYATDSMLRASGGMAGWITAFTLPFTFEIEVYGLKDGAWTKPVTASDGTYIFRRVKSRTALGRRMITHLLIADLPEADAATRRSRKALADSLYRLVQQGANLEQLASRYSNDRTSSFKGGRMEPIAVGDFEDAFANPVFRLEREGEVAPVFQTSYGWHIVRLDSISMPGRPGWDEDMRRLAATKGIEAAAREAASERLKQQVGFKKANYRADSALSFTINALRNQSTAATGIRPTDRLFSIGERPFTMADWMAYLNENRPGAVGSLGTFNRVMAAYEQYEVLQAYRRQLGALEPEFATAVKDFKEANMLFEVTDKTVWSRASADSTGRMAFYEKNKTRYQWADNANVLVVTALNDSAGKVFRETLRTNPALWREKLGELSNLVLADSLRMELSNLPWQVQDPSAVQQGFLSPVVTDSVNGVWLFFYTFSRMPSGATKTPDECMGQLLADYQLQLEAYWLERLRKKYPVKRQESVWQQVLDRSK